MNSIKVKPVLKRKKFALNEDQANLIKEAFDLFDLEKTGSIDYHELKLTLKAFGFKITKQDLQELLDKYDKDNKNRIFFDDFIELITEKFSERDPKEEILLAFDLFDTEKRGKINIKNLKKAVKEIGENLSDAELKAIIEEFDEDQDGEISKSDFLKIMEEYYFD
jgi:centrin-3